MCRYLLILGLVRRKAGRPVPLEASILQAFVAVGVDRIHGFALAKVLAGESAKALTGHGTLYRALERMEAAGWLTSEWEGSNDAVAAGRPQRRLYSITSAGRDVVAVHMAEQVTDRSGAWVVP